MPSHYDYRCTSCGLTETRYRNAQVCHKCGAPVERLAPLPDKSTTRESLGNRLANVTAERDVLASLLSNALTLAQELLDTLQEFVWWHMNCVKPGSGDDDLLNNAETVITKALQMLPMEEGDG